MFNPLPLVRAHLKQSPVSSLALAALIALAAALGVAVSAQDRALRAGSAAAARPFDIVVGAPGSETQLVLSTVFLQPASLELMPAGLLARLATDERVKFAAPIGFGDSWHGHSIVGTSADFIASLAGTLPEGRMFGHIGEAVVGARVPLQVGEHFLPTHGQFASAEAEAVALGNDDHDGDGHDADDHDHEHEDGEPAGEEHHHHAEVNIVGRLAPTGGPWDQAILVPIEATWWVHGLPVGHPLDAAATDIDHPDPDGIPVGPPWDEKLLSGVPAIVVKPVSFSAAYGLRADYRSAESIAVFPAEVLVQLYGLLGNVRDILAGLSIMTQALVIGAVLVAVLALTVRRRRTFGVLRAMGATRAYIFSLIWCEVALLVAGGALAGLGLGYGAAAGLSRLVSGKTDMAMTVSLGLPELSLAGIIILVGLILATVPAFLIYREPVTRALRD
ncbi:FtsX-like permease family protein [Radicibacter daui]|uniref:FtsX-like permease family protein n=1 Tax=Radicibacter daui TaxID=3064829 RepID=UPI004046C8D1